MYLYYLYYLFIYLFNLFLGVKKAPISSDLIESFDLKYIHKIMLISNDLSCILRHPPTPEVLTEPLRNAFLEGMKAYLTVLMLFEDTDAVKRKVGNHAPTDVEWKKIFIIQKVLQPVTTSFIEWMSQSSILLLQAANQVIDVLKQLHPPENMQIAEDKIFSDYTCKV